MKSISIQVHYREPDGLTGVMNYFTADNALDTYQRLLTKAHKVAAAWTVVYPETSFTVVEVEHGRRRQS
jgi:hypothetical protein